MAKGEGYSSKAYQREEQIVLGLGSLTKTCSSIVICVLPVNLCPFPLDFIKFRGRNKLFY